MAKRPLSHSQWSTKVSTGTLEQHPAAERRQVRPSSIDSLIATDGDMHK